jgi:hypothetical protein
MIDDQTDELTWRASSSTIPPATSATMRLVVTPQGGLVTDGS